MNNFPFLKKTGQESEYKSTPSFLPISSVGTNYTTANQTNLPYASALLTDTLDGSGKGNSTLKNKGITHIIHAAPNSEGSFSNRDDFIQQVVKAVQNCILLADREDIQSQVKIEKLAICFVGGGIFCNNESTKPLLAESIIKGALNQVEKCQKLKEIIFVSFKGAQDQAYYLKDAWDNIKKDTKFKDKMKKAKVEKGDIRDKNVHGANVIVNAANTQVTFGSGISGAISSETGNKTAIDNKAKEWIGKFYSLIKKNKENDNSDKITWQGWYKSRGTDLLFGGEYFYFVSSGVEDHPFLPREFTLSVSLDHPIFKNNPPEKNQEYKFSYKKVDADKGKCCFRKGDSIEVEEVKDSDQNQNQTPPKTCASCSNTFPAGSGIIFNNKDYCSNECSLKQQEENKDKDKDKDKPNKNDNISQVRTSAISDIQQALNSEPKLTNSDLLSDYQNWESIIKQLNSESEVNNLKEKVLSDIKIKRKNKQDSATRDEKINSAHTEDEKINLLKEMGSSLGETTPEQKTKLEQVKDSLATNPTKLREGIQKEIIAWMTSCGVQKEDLDSETKNQWESLKSQNNPDEIRAIEKKVNQAIGIKGVNKKINSLTQLVNAALKNKQKTEIQEVKKKLLECISSPNSFYQQQKSQFQALLQKLEGTQKQSPNQTSNNPEFPWKVVVPVLLVSVGGMIGAVIIFRKTKKRKH